MGLCSGSGFLHAIKGGQRIAQKASYLATSSQYERRRNIIALHKSEYYPEGNGSDLFHAAPRLTHVQYTQTDTIRQTDGPLVPMVRLVPMEKHPIPMVLLVNMHLIKGT